MLPKVIPWRSASCGDRHIKYTLDGLKHDTLQNRGVSQMALHKYYRTQVLVVCCVVLDTRRSDGLDTCRNDGVDTSYV